MTRSLLKDVESVGDGMLGTSPEKQKKKFLLSFDSTFTCNMVIYLSKLIKDGMIPSSKQ